MKEQFLNYKLSNKLFRLGFDEPVFAHYMTSEAWKLDLGVGSLYLKDKFEKDSSEYSIPAPLYQQVADWFREKHNLSGEIYHYQGSWHFDIRDTDKEIDLHRSETEVFIVYQEAREKLVEKLIEIVENKNE